MYGWVLVYVCVVQSIQHSDVPPMHNTINYCGWFGRFSNIVCVYVNRSLVEYKVGESLCETHFML